MEEKQIPLYIACPCHEKQLPDSCSQPHFWYHADHCCPKASSTDLQERLICSSCQRKTHIKNVAFHCNETNSYRSVTSASFSNVLRCLGQIIGDAEAEEDLNFLIQLKKKLFSEKSSW